jgi:hypothetical protein
LAQSGTNRWRWIGFTSWHLQLDEADDFLRHAFLLAGTNVLANSPGLATLLHPNSTESGSAGFQIPLATRGSQSITGPWKTRSSQPDQIPIQQVWRVQRW